MSVAREYGCLIEDKGIMFSASYLIDPKGVLRQITMNDLPVGRSADEELRLVQAFQFTVSDLSCPVNWKVGRRSRATPSRNSITLLQLMVNTRTARRMVPSVPTPTTGWGGV
jgi:alkyl hydroperoxide reductase subunit AhpC